MAIWIMKAGYQGAIADKFKSENKIAIGWEHLSSFAIDGTWEQFRERIKQKLPSDYSAQRVGHAAGQLWAFAREMKLGDYVITPVKHSREVLVGKVVGDYKYDVNFDEHYQGTRKVQWYTPIPWDSVPQALRSSFSAQLTVGQPRADFMPVILNAQNKITAPVQNEIVDNDGAEEPIVEDLSDRAEELIRQMLRDMSHVNFQRFVGGIFQAASFTVLYDSAGRGRDGGIDIILSRDSLGAGERIVVQVKHTGGPVGQPELQQLLGTLRPGEWGLMVSLSGINSNSERYWRENRDKLLKPIESSDLIKLLQLHYERLDDEFKSLLPLRRTYVPFTLDMEQ